MQEVSVFICQGKRAIGKEFLLDLEIAILKGSFFQTLFQSQPRLGLNLIQSETLGLEMSCLIFTKSLLMR